MTAFTSLNATVRRYRARDSRVLPVTQQIKQDKIIIIIIIIKEEEKKREREREEGRSRYREMRPYLPWSTSV